MNKKIKKVLILCTANSCRSIIAEALINAELDNIEAQSSGVKASGCVNPNAKKILEKNNIWSETYHSKTIDNVVDKEFDLVVTVCDNAKESCPTFPQKTKVIHVGFEDPDGQEFSAFQECYHDIKTRLLPHVKKVLS